MELDRLDTEEERIFDEEKSNEREWNLHLTILYILGLGACVFLAVSCTDRISYMSHQR
jgi:hypothetical protein